MGQVRAYAPHTRSARRASLRVRAAACRGAVGGRKEPPPVEEVTVVPADLRRDIRTLLIQGRWLLVAAETAVSLALLPVEIRDTPALWMLSLLAVYNVASLMVVRRVALRRLPVPLVLGFDL